LWGWRVGAGGRGGMCVYVEVRAYGVRDGGWDTQRGALGETVLRTLEEYAPGLTSRVVARQVLTPADLERTYGLTGGHPAHGEPALDQLFLARPLLGWGRYR